MRPCIHYSLYYSFPKQNRRKYEEREDEEDSPTARKAKRKILKTHTKINITKSTKRSRSDENIARFE